MTLVVSAAILVVGAGTAAAIVLSGQGNSTTTVTPARERSAAPGTSVATTPSQVPSSSGTVEAAGFPAVSRTQMTQEIQSLLLSYHQDVVGHRFPAAWALLSARKRQQGLREYGYQKWVRAQASLSPYLSPSGLKVRIDALEGEGVARILVTGMGWSGPGSSCTEWSGLTWVKYEDGQWTYDPGYSTTLARRQQWKPRSSELLGAGC